MKLRNFTEDLNNSNNPKLRESWKDIIRKKFGNDCIIYFKDEITTQLDFGTDIIVKTNKGRRYSIELKTRAFNTLYNENYIMEIAHHIYNKKEKPNIKIRTKEGWLYTTTAEYIFHATLNESGKEITECIFYTLHPFKNESWKSNFNNFNNLWLSTGTDFGNYQLTLNKLIPKDIIKKNAFQFWEWRKENGN